MTSEQIEREVERRIDRLDARFMRDDSTMQQHEYDAAIRAIDQWAEDQYARIGVQS